MDTQRFTEMTMKAGIILALVLVFPAVSFAATSEKKVSRTSLIKAIEAIERRDRAIIRNMEPENETRKAEIEDLRARAKNTKASEEDMRVVRNQVSLEAGRVGWERMIEVHLNRIEIGMYRNTVNRITRMKGFFAGEDKDFPGARELISSASLHLAAAESKTITTRHLLSSKEMDFVSMKKAMKPYLLDIPKEIKEANQVLLEVAKLVNKSK